MIGGGERKGRRERGGERGREQREEGEGKGVPKAKQHKICDKLSWHSSLGQHKIAVSFGVVSRWVDVQLILGKIVIPLNDIHNRIDDPFLEQAHLFIAAMGISPNAPTSVNPMFQR